MNIEILETRVAPAAVSSFAAGVLTIAGDTGANDISISEQATPGAYHVTGLDAGQAADFIGVTRIVVTVDGGDDTVVFNGDATAGTSLRSVAVSGTGELDVTFNANFNVRGSVTITHTGNDAPAADEDLSVVVTGSGAVLGQLIVRDGISDSAVSVLAGARISGGLIHNGGAGGDDDLTLNAAVVGGAITKTSTGIGKDDLTMVSSTVRGSLKLRADGGNVQMTDSRINGTLSVSFVGSSADMFSITGGSSIGGNLLLRGGVGNDSINLTDATIAGRASLALGLDNNSAILGNTRVGGSLSIVGGSGSDTVDVGSSDLGGSFTASLGLGTNSTNLSNFSSGGLVRIAGGAGADSITATALAVQGAFLTELGDGINSAALSGSVGAVIGLSGVGMDSFILSSLLVRGQTRLITGGGNDSVLTADATFNGAFSFVGGAGVDTLNLEEALGSDNGIATTFRGTFFFDGGLGDDRAVLGASTDDSAIFTLPAILNGGFGNDALSRQFAVSLSSFFTFSFTI